MRFMAIVKANEASEAGVLPTRQQLTDMGKFNETLVRDGVLLAMEGLRPSSQGVRLRFGGSGAAITDGPFAEAKELIGGFWIVQGKSKQEVVERFTLTPMLEGAEIEIRQIFEADDFGENLPPQVRAQEERFRGTTK